MNRKEVPSNYMAQLDGLRAIAVGMVVLFHWTPQAKQMAAGGLGVLLFFVLSGYLISGILLEAREKAESLEAGKRQILKSFYARRLLRIFPLYYLVLLLTYLLGAPNIQAFFPWHLAYLTNFAIFLEGKWIGEASHLWSLAVEEQFYLLWPFVMLFTPRRYLLHTVVGFILLAPLFKLACAGLGVEATLLGALPISSLHYLGAGALLALLERGFQGVHASVSAKRLAVGIQVLGWGGLSVFLGIRLWPDMVVSGLAAQLMAEFGLTFFLVYLVRGAAQGFAGSFGRFLSCGPLVYLGKISYGLYLFHNFIPYFGRVGLQQVNIPLSTNGFLLVCGAILILFSALSWHLFESRLNAYKRHFPYVQAKRKVEAPQVLATA